VPGAVAWTVADAAGGMGQLWGLRDDILPSSILQPGTIPSGPLGTDGQGTFYWAEKDRVSSYRAVPPSYTRDLFTAPVMVTGLTASSSFVFTTGDDGDVNRVNSTGDALQTIASIGTPGYRIAVSGNLVYWATRTQIYQVGINGGTPQAVAGFAAGRVVDFQVVGGDIYWLAEAPQGTVRRTRPAEALTPG